MVWQSSVEAAVSRALAKGVTLVLVMEDKNLQDSRQIYAAFHHSQGQRALS